VELYSFNTCTSKLLFFSTPVLPAPLWPELYCSCQLEVHLIICLLKCYLMDLDFIFSLFKLLFIYFFIKREFSADFHVGYLYWPRKVEMDLWFLHSIIEIKALAFHFYAFKDIVFLANIMFTPMDIYLANTLRLCSFHAPYLPPFLQKYLSFTD